MTKRITTDYMKTLLQALEDGQDIEQELKSLLFDEKKETELLFASKESVTTVLADTLSLPLQKVRTFGKEKTDLSDWENKLIFGDNLQAMRQLLEMKRRGELKNSDGSDGIRLIYIDPPFASDRDYKSSQTNETAYQDKVAGAQFLGWLRKRLIILRELLAENGSIYVHLDPRRVHYVKVIMDEIFGENHYQREIIWRMGWLSGYKTKANNYIRNHDVILYYSKTENLIFNKSYIPYPKDYVRRDGKPPTGSGYPIEDTWNCYEIDKMDSIQIVSFSKEKTGYPTQKNETLLERIITSSCNDGDLVLDAFAGSGTTLAVAEKLNRRWIGIDCGKLSIYTIQKRMLNLRSDIGNQGSALKAKPFTLYNAGLYDLNSLKHLPWQDWRNFALMLFGCIDKKHTIGGINFDGTFRSFSVQVFDHRLGGNAVITEESIQSMHQSIKRKIGSKAYIIGPALSFGFQQDFIELDNTRYYALRIPYSIINELHQRQFQALEQPKTLEELNKTVEAIGFDFIRAPEIEYSIAHKVSDNEKIVEIEITRFESDAGIRKPNPLFGNLETLSMVLADYDFDSSTDIFEMSDVFYADTIKKDDWKIKIQKSKLGHSIMLIFIDIYGNEARERIEMMGNRGPKRDNKKK